MSSGRNDPYTNFRFRVEISDLEVAGFSEVTGLESETEVIEYREGGEIGTVRKIPGITRYANIVLKRGVTVSRELFEWRKSVIDGQTDRRSGSIVLLDEARQEVARWNFFDGWPCRWKGPDLDGKTSEIAIEELEICHEGLDLG